MAMPGLIRLLLAALLFAPPAANAQWITNGESGSSVRGKLNTIPNDGMVANTNSVVITSGTNLAAGTSVSLDASGQAVQTWGPAPNIAGIVYPFPTFANGDTPSILMMGSGAFVSFWTSNGAVASTISGTTITLGSVNNNAILAAVPRTNDGPLYRPLAASLSTSLFVVGYSDGSQVNVAAVSLSGTTMTVGTPVQVSSQTFLNVLVNSIKMLDATHFVFAYTLADNSINAVIGSVSGTTITLGTPVQITASGGASQPLVALALSASKVVFLYFDSNIFVVAGSISGTTLTLGSALQTDVLLSQMYPIGCEIDATHFVVGGNSDNSQAALQAGSVSGTTITLGTAVLVSPPLNQVNNPYVQNLGGGNFVVFPVSSDAPLLGTVSGTTISFGTALPLADQPTVGGETVVYSGVAVFSSTSFMFSDILGSVYQQLGAKLSSPLRHQVLSPGYWLYPIDSSRALATLRPWDGKFAARVVSAAANVGAPIGFVASSVSSGDPATVTFSGVASGFSGLTPGTFYYNNGNGTLTASNTGNPAGTALSSSTILIGRQ